MDDELLLRLARVGKTYYVRDRAGYVLLRRMKSPMMVLTRDYFPLLKIRCRKFGVALDVEAFEDIEAVAHDKIKK